MAGRVLVVDDVPELAAILCRQISRAGYVAEPCSSVEEAARRLAEGAFACTLVDVFFGFEPKGWELLRTIRSDPRTANIPVVSMSGSGPRVLERCLDYGADAVVAKPFILPEFLAAMEKAVAARQAAN